MISRLEIENFKGIQKASLDLPRITLLIGPNNSGKSSVIQALVLLKNFLLNHNKDLDDLLNFGYLNLGKFSEVIWQHKVDRKIKITATIDHQSYLGKYSLTLGQPTSSSALEILKPFPSTQIVQFEMPYNLDKMDTMLYLFQKPNKRKEEIKLEWNGVSLDASPKGVLPNFDSSKNSHDAFLKSVYLIPTGIAFTKHSFNSSSAVSDLRDQLVIPEDLLASKFDLDADFEEKVTEYLTRIFDIRNIRAKPIQSNLSLIIGRRKFATNIINEGFGLNRIVLLLASIIQPSGYSLICIEEPESHLHPSAQGKLAKVLTEIVKDEDKQLIISTHSEHMLLSFLTSISKGVIDKNEVAIYFTDMDANEMRTTFEKADINELGQIKGGLRGFFDADVDALSEALKSLGAKSE